MVRRRSKDWRKLQSPSQQSSSPVPKLKVKAAILDAIENQIRDLDPPETKQTYDRLMAEGHSSDEAMRLLGCALVSELSAAMKTEQPYNETRYVANLSQLPKLPWESS